MHSLVGTFFSKGVMVYLLRVGGIFQKSPPDFGMWYMLSLVVELPPFGR